MLVSIAATSLAAPLERHRTFYRDRWVEYIVRDGLAVAERDIILGTAADIAERAGNPLKALIIDQSALLWPIGPSGVHEVPYVFEAGPEFNVEAAVVLFNASLRDSIRFVRRTTQKDYVAFNLRGPNGSCYSYIGRIGGRQEIGGDPECEVGPLLHEMGHAIGFWHIQSDAAQGSFLDIRYDTMDPTWRSQYIPELSARTIDGYDYASIMHYSPFVPSTTPDALVASTLPAGIDIGQTDGYSASDIDAFKRLYGQVPVAVTITTNPPGLQVVVDGITKTTPSVQLWRMGSLHRLNVASGIHDYGLFKVAFARWSHDPSASPKTAQEWIVEPGKGFQGEPASSPRMTVLTANFVRLVQVQSVVSGGAFGAVTVTPETAPWPGTTDFFPQYTKFTLAATPKSGYLHDWYTSPSWYPVTGGSGGVATATRRIAPESPTQMGASFYAGPGVIVQAAGAGVDGAHFTHLVLPGAGGEGAIGIPTVLTGTPSSRYKLSIDANQAQYRSETVRFMPKSIDGLDNNLTGEIAMPGAGSPNRIVTVNFERQVYPLVERNPECGGTVTLSAPEDYLPLGRTLNATATAAAGIVFAGWTGTFTTPSNSISMTVDRVPEFYANFNAIAEPLTLTRIAPATYSPGQGAQTFELTGTGFSAKTLLLFADGRSKPGQLINSRTFRITLSEADFPTQGKVVVYAGALLAPACMAVSAAALIDVAPKVTPEIVTVREYYNPALNRYFITANADEGRAIELDPFSQERVSGLTFKAWKTTAYPPGANVVYRFYGSVNPGPNSHFFTANIDEARALQRTELDAPVTSKRWNYEEMSFAIKAPQNGVCSADAPVKIYRAYNDGFRRGVDSNHRLTSDVDQYAQMIAAGWIGEGVAMCGPQ